MSRWSAPIDIYCERTSAAFWAEPVNALTNIAFILAALWAADTARRTGRGGIDISILIGLAALIGVGSFLFHTFATGWSALADVAPIWSFVLLCIFSALYRIGGVAPKRIALGASGLASVLLIALLVGLSGDSGAPLAPDAPRAPPPLNGSLQYAPAWIAMVVFSILAIWRRNPVASWILAATLIFTLSLTMRTIDPMWCNTLPLGTHFLWHLLNGLMIGLVLQALLRAPPPNPV